MADQEDIVNRDIADGSPATVPIDTAEKLQALRRVQGRLLKLLKLDDAAWEKILKACGDRKWKGLWLELRRTHNAPGDLDELDKLLKRDYAAGDMLIHPAWGRGAPMFNMLMRKAKLPYRMVRTPISGNPDCYTGTVQIMEEVSDGRKQRKKRASLLDWA